jgi:hypothetical protein
MKKVLGLPFDAKAMLENSPATFFIESTLTPEDAW